MPLHPSWRGELQPTTIARPSPMRPSVARARGGSRTLAMSGLLEGWAHAVAQGSSLAEAMSGVSVSQWAHALARGVGIGLAQADRRRRRRKDDK